MYRECKADGVVSEKIGKKGVLLARRDNSAFVRNIYESVISQISRNVGRNDILYYVLDQINQLCSNTKPIDEFVVTKAVGSCGDLKPEQFVNEKGKNKIRVGDYTVPELSEDKDKRNEQLAKKGAADENEFYLFSLPAQVQLAERMKRRGQRVDAGQRLEYLVTDIENHTANQYEKVESIEYFKKYSQILTVDHLYYLKALATPLDQVLNVAFGKDKDYKEDFVLYQYKYRWQVRTKVMKSIRALSAPRLCFEE